MHVLRWARAYGCPHDGNAIESPEHSGCAEQIQCVAANGCSAAYIHLDENEESSDDDTTTVLTTINAYQ
jgi:hypothetical protein